MTKRKERHSACIDSLEKAMFPFIESEEEQVRLTPEGRRRVDEWIEESVDLLTVERTRAVLSACLKGFIAGKKGSKAS